MISLLLTKLKPLGFVGSSYSPLGLCVIELLVLSSGGRADSDHQGRFFPKKMHFRIPMPVHLPIQKYQIEHEVQFRKSDMQLKPTESIKKVSNRIFYFYFYFLKELARDCCLLGKRRQKKKKTGKQSPSEGSGSYPLPIQPRLPIEKGWLASS